MFTAIEISAANADTNQTARHIIFQPMKSTSSATYTIEIDNFKIEKGNKPTDWTLSPDDMNKTTTEVIVGTQTASTGSWTGNASFSSLKDGQQIAYWLPYAGSGNASLNLTLADGTTTGAIACYYSGTSRITTHYAAGNVIHLTYRVNANVNGSTVTGWWADANYNTNDNTYDRIRLNSAVTAKSAISAGRLITGDDSGYFHIAASTAFDINKPILYAGSAISANATGTNNYLTFPNVNVASSKSGWTGTTKKTCYVVGTLSGNKFTPNSTLFTTTEPTSEDNLYYIALGLMVDTTKIYLYPEHPIYKYKDGAFKSIAQMAYDAQVDIDSTEIGGRNLLLGTRTQNTSKGNYINAQETNDAFLGCKVFKSSNAYDDIGFNLTRVIKDNNLKIGDELTYSIYNKTDDTVARNFSFYVPNTSNSRSLKSFSKVLNTDWTKMIITFKIDQLMIDKLTGAQPARLECNTTNTSDTYQYWAAPKLELGNKATDWTPAPEDLETSISDAKKTANDASGIANSAKENADTALQKATTAKDTVDLLNQWKVDFTAENGEFTVGLRNANNAAKAASDKADGVDDKLDKDIAARNQYMRYSAQADEYGNIKGTLELGDSDSKFKAKINNTELGFYEDDVRVSYINGQKMYITNAEILHLLGIGNFGFQVEADNSVSFGKIK